MLKLQDLHRLTDYSDEEEFYSRDCGMKQRKEVMMIRKDNRNQLFKKRRIVARQPKQLSSQHQDQQKDDPVIIFKTEPKQAYELLKRVFLPSEIDELIDKLKSNKLLEKLQGVIGLRSLLQLDKVSISKLIQSGAVDEMIILLEKSQWPQVQYQSTWALADIASGDQQQSQYLIKKNCINIFYQLMHSGPHYLIRNCALFFGNFACNSSTHRDAILQTGVLDILVDAFQKYKNNEILVTDILWTIRNLCRGNPQPKYSLVKKAVEAIAMAMAEGIFSSQDPFRQGLWTISCHSDQKQGKIVIDTNLYLKLVEIVNDHQIKRLIFPCLRVIRDLLTFPCNIGKLMEAQVLDGLTRSLKHKNIYICMEACCGLCNILKSKNQEYILQLLKRQQTVNAMKEMLRCQSVNMKLQIAVSFCMMCECNNEKLDLQLIQLNILAEFSSLLTSHNPEIVIEMLKALEIPLMLSAEHSEKRNAQNLIAVELNNVGIAAIIEKLQNHQNEEVYKHAWRLLETYFILQEVEQPKQTKQAKKERRITQKSDMWEKKAMYLKALQ